MPRVLGVDVASRSWADNGSAVLEFDARAVKRVTPGAIAWPGEALTPEALAAAIDAYARAQSVCAVALDGPQGWRDPATPAEAPGVGRRCEVACNTQGKTGTFGVTYPSTQRTWIEFAIAVFDALLTRPGVVLANTLTDTLPDGYAVLECFPTSAWRASGLQALPGKGKRPVLGPYVDALRSTYALPPFTVTSHDDLQAVVAALCAASVVGGPLTALPRGVPALELVDADGARRRVEGIIWDVQPRSGPAQNPPFSRSNEISGTTPPARGATASVRSGAPKVGARSPRRRRGAATEPAVCVTRGVLDQLERLQGAHAMMITLYGLPGGTKSDRRRVVLGVDGDAYELIVGDSHAAWRSHQTSATLPHFDALFARLAKRPGETVAVTTVELRPLEEMKRG